MNTYHRDGSIDTEATRLLTARSTSIAIIENHREILRDVESRSGDHSEQIARIKRNITRDEVILASHEAELEARGVDFLHLEELAERAATKGGDISGEQFRHIIAGITPDGPVGWDGKPAGGSKRSLGDAGEQTMRNLDVQVRSGAMRAGAAENVEKVLRSVTGQRDPRIGDDLARRSNPDLAQATARALFGGDAQRMSMPENEVRAIRESRSSLTLGSGYVLPVAWDAMFSDTSALVTGLDVFKSLARSITIADSEYSGVASSGVTAGWRNELDPLTDGSPNVSPITVTPKNYAAQVTFSWEAGDGDVPGLLDQIQLETVSAVGSLLATAIISGSGTGTQPKGLLTALGSSKDVTTAAAGVANAADYYNVVSAVPARYIDAAQWIAPVSTINAAAQVGPVASQVGVLSPDGSRLAQKPISEASAVPAFAAGAQAGILGDWSRLLLVTRLGSTIEPVSQVTNSSGEFIGARALIVRGRFGVGVSDANAFRVLKVHA